MIDDLRRMRDEAQVLLDASRRITQTDSTQTVLKSRYNKFRHWYAPANGDQWPWDAKRRPGKVHISINILKPAVDIDSRLQSILPRLVCEPPTHDEETEKRAEATEKLILESFEMTGWDVWMNDLTKTKSLLGKGVIKAFWNTEDDRPDCSIIETPENLRIGWGSDDFTRMDWALYEYKISPFQAAQQYGVSVRANRDGIPTVYSSGTKHDDPLGQRPIAAPSAAFSEPRQPSDYEQGHVDVWDYWYKRKGEKRAQVWNAVIVGTSKGRVVVSNRQFEDMPDIPYIVIENDHRPGDPDGMSTIEHLTDFQEEYNRLVSHWLQLIADNTDPAWQAVGPGADSVPAGIVPKAGQIIALGADIRIEPIEKPQNQVPLEQAIGALWDSFHKESGLPEITFGTMPGAQTSGRAMAVQIEAVQNRADPRRRRLYRGLRELILFWLYMAEQRDWKLEVTLPNETASTDDQAASIVQPEGEKPRTVKMPVKRVIAGMRRWKIVEPELTPRDSMEHARTQIEILNARGQSLHRFMDQIGVDAPLQELARIIEERSNAAIFPGDVQAQVAAAATLLQMRMQMAAMEQQQAAAGIAAGGQAQDMAAQGQGAGFLQQQNAQAQPSAGDESTGGELAASGPGSGSPGTPPGLGTMQTLIRGQGSGQAQTLQQTSIRRPI